MFSKKKVHERIKPPVSWFNDSLREIRANLSCIKAICDCTKNAEDYAAYRAYRNHYRYRLNTVKKTAYNKYISESENKPKSSWQIINHELNKKPKTQVIPDVPIQIFSNFFANVAENIISCLPNTTENSVDLLSATSTSCNSFFLIPIMPYEIIEAVKSLKKSKCLDCYDLSSEIIKGIIEEIIEPLATLFNLCITTGCFPTCFKYAKVLPLWKKGDKSLVDNYRPISIIPVLGKIFEIILKNRLVQYFVNNNLFSKYQYGFRAGKSTTDALLKIVSCIVEGLERGDIVAITLCDLSKAFDCVSHNSLFEKLEYYGVRGLPLKLFKSYLTDRTQSVYVNDTFSGVENILHGVPQGSVLGPLLFLIYVNDFSNFMLPNQSVLFADDTSLVSTGKNLQMLSVNKDKALKLATEWFTVNQLKLNENKTKEIIFSSNSSSSEQTGKLLGITLDGNLSWTTHINELNVKLSKSIFALRQLKKVVDLHVLKTAYYAMFHSHINYGIILWGDSSQSMKIFRQQKKALRIMMNAEYRDHCKPLFKSLGIFPLPSLFIYNTILEIHKNKSQFSKHLDIHHYQTRNAELLIKPCFRLTKSQKNSLNINLYNHIPEYIKQLNPKSFKLKMKSCMLENCFYSIDEYLNANIS